MPESGARRSPRKLSAETKWEVFLSVASGEVTQAEAARKWQVDVSTVIGIRRTVKDAAMAALARGPGRPTKERDWQLEAARTEIGQLTEAIKAQAIELSIVRGKACQWPSCCPRWWPTEVLAGGQRKSSRSGLLAGGAVGEPVAVAGGGDDVGVVAEPVEQRDGGGLVGQEAAPVFERAV